MISTNEERMKKLSDFQESLKDKTLDELKQMEQDIIKEADDVDKVISKTEYNLPTENYKEVAEAIRYFLDKKTVGWQYTLAMINIYEFWKPTKKAKKIPYAQLDSTLRILGDMQFTGYEEWKKVVTVNTYFQPLHNAFVNDTGKVYEVAGKHDAIIQAMQKKDPTAVNPQDNGTVKDKQ